MADVADQKNYEQDLWNKQLSLEDRLQACNDWIADVAQQMEMSAAYRKHLCLEDLMLVLLDTKQVLLQELRAKGGGGPEGPLH